MLSIYSAALTLLVIAYVTENAAVQARSPPRRPSVTVHRGNATRPGQHRTSKWKPVILTIPLYPQTTATTSSRSARVTSRRPKLLPTPIPLIRSGLPSRTKLIKVTDVPAKPTIVKRQQETASPSSSPTERFGFPFCTETVETPAIDPNGYQYGWDWELDESCIIDASPLSMPSAMPTAWLGFPICKYTVDSPTFDDKGYQYGWDWNARRTCIVYAAPVKQTRTASWSKTRRSKTAWTTMFTTPAATYTTSSSKSTTSVKTSMSSARRWSSKSKSKKSTTSSSSKAKKSTTSSSSTTSSLKSTTTRSSSKSKSTTSSTKTSTTTTTTAKPSRTEKFGFPICTDTVEKPSIDKNGYQYGWDDELDESCIVDEAKPSVTRKDGFPVCTAPVDKPAVDPQGKEYGWDSNLGESCLVTGN